MPRPVRPKGVASEGAAGSRVAGRCEGPSPDGRRRCTERARGRRLGRMKAGAAAAPRYRRQVGLATVVLAVLAGLGFVTSQALAGGALVPQIGTESTPTSTTVASTTAAPIPDPQPAPKPDPKPASSRQRAKVTSPPPPPPPPPPLGRAARQSTTPTTSTPTRATVPPSTRPRAEPPGEAVAVAPPVRRRVRVSAVRKARAEPPAAPRTKPVPRPRRGSATPASQTLALDASPITALSETTSPPSGVPALVLPLLGLGLLLLGASAVSARRVPWPALVVPLEAHRLDLAAVGIGAIALALLLLNVTVFL
jgi:hypothetical protein